MAAVAIAALVGITGVFGAVQMGSASAHGPEADGCKQGWGHYFKESESNKYLRTYNPADRIEHSCDEWASDTSGSK